jgi:hypothetical protein
MFDVLNAALGALEDFAKSTMKGIEIGHTI